MDTGTCRSCGQTIGWVDIHRQHVPIDPTPNVRGQVIVLRDDRRALPVIPGQLYPQEVQDRRYYDHRSTCSGWASLRTVKGSAGDPGYGRSTEQKERVRALKVALDRQRDGQPNRLR